MFVEPGDEVYEGMIVGENAREQRHRRQHREGEEAHQHARVDVATSAVRLLPRAQHVARAGARVDRATTSCSRSRRSRSGCASACCRPTCGRGTGRRDKRRRRGSGCPGSLRGPGRPPSPIASRAVAKTAAADSHPIRSVSIQARPPQRTTDAPEGFALRGVFVSSGREATREDGKGR